MRCFIRTNLVSNGIYPEHLPILSVDLAIPNSSLMVPLLRLELSEFFSGNSQSNAIGLKTLTGDNRYIDSGR
jgi:hypothetical protein